MILMFPLLGLSREDSFKRVFSTLFLGMVLHGFGMILFAFAFSPLEMYIGIANVVSMTVTVSILSALFAKGESLFTRISHSGLGQLDRKFVLQIAGFVLAFIVFELIFFN